MSHNLGRLVFDRRTFGHAASLDLVPSLGPLGDALRNPALR
jgi:hypothetical protein